MDRRTVSVTRGIPSWHLGNAATNIDSTVTRFAFHFTWWIIQRGSRRRGGTAPVASADYELARRITDL